MRWRPVASARRVSFTRLAAVAAAAFAPLAAAHTGSVDAHDFVGGLLHPLTGLDHVLAMVAVGALAWTLGGPARWRLPAAFLAAMTLGLGLVIAHDAGIQGSRPMAWASGFFLATAGLNAAGLLLAAAVSAARSRARSRTASQASRAAPSR